MTLKLMLESFPSLFFALVNLACFFTFSPLESQINEVRIIEHDTPTNIFCVLSKEELYDIPSKNYVEVLMQHPVSTITASGTANATLPSQFLGTANNI